MRRIILSIVLFASVCGFHCNPPSEIDEELSIWKFSHITETYRSGKMPTYARNDAPITAEEKQRLVELFEKYSVLYFFSPTGELWVSTISIRNLGEMHAYDSDLFHQQVHLNIK